MADELFTAETWAIDTLRAFSGLADLIGGPLNIYPGKAPQGASYPHIQLRYISPVGGGDMNDLGGYRVWTRARFLIVAVINKRSFKSISPIVTKCDQALELEGGTGEGGLVQYCKREAPYQQSYEENGISYSEAGAFWEIAVTGT